MHALDQARIEEAIWWYEINYTCPEIRVETLDNQQEFIFTGKFRLVIMAESQIEAQQKLSGLTEQYQKLQQGRQ